MSRQVEWTIVAAVLIAAAWCEKRAVAVDGFDAGMITRATINLVEQEHLVHRPLDVKLSQKWFAAFLARLDPRRMYFLQADVREFAPFEKRLDDLARTESFEFAKLVRKRFQTRVAEAAKYAEDYVAAPHDFSVDEAIPKRFDDHAATADELRERWRQRIKLEMLIEKVYGRPTGEVQSQLTDRYRRILRQAREMDDERSAEAYLGSLLSLYDADSGYMSPAMLSSFATHGLIREYEIGIGFRESAGRLMLKNPGRRIPGVLQPLEGFQLIAIRRLDGRVLDVVEMPSDEVDHLIRWPALPLGDEKEVILELMKTDTFERLAVKCQRSSPKR